MTEPSSKFWIQHRPPGGWWQTLKARPADEIYPVDAESGDLVFTEREAAAQAALTFSALNPGLFRVWDAAVPLATFEVFVRGRIYVQQHGSDELLAYPGEDVDVAVLDLLVWTARDVALKRCRIGKLVRRWAQEDEQAIAAIFSAAREEGESCTQE